MLILIGFPFGFAFFLSIFWFSYKYYSKENVLLILENFLVTTLITFFFFQSSVINALTKLLNCTKIENNYYLTNYLFEKCEGNKSYERWSNFMIIPSFLFFSFALTFFPFFYMFKNRKKLYTASVLRRVGFLLNGYSTRHYYW